MTKFCNQRISSRYNSCLKQTMSFGDVIMSGGVTFAVFVRCCKIDKRTKSALSRNNERTWAKQIIKLRPNVNCQNVVLLSIPVDDAKSLLSAVSYASTCVNFLLRLSTVSVESTPISTFGIKNERKDYCAAPNNSHNLNT